MIKKFVCWLVGHIYEGWYCTGKYRSVYSPFFGGSVGVPIKYKHKLDYCRRCGVKLDTLVKKG